MSAICSVNVTDCMKQILRACMVRLHGHSKAEFASVTLIDLLDYSATQATRPTSLLSEGGYGCINASKPMLSL